MQGCTAPSLRYQTRLSSADPYCDSVAQAMPEIHVLDLIPREALVEISRPHCRCENSESEIDPPRHFFYLRDPNHRGSRFPLGFI